jgi:transcriptional regulator CtsR
MARDEDFYDNDPYTHEEKRVLAERGQLATNFNVISTTLNWVIGTQRRARTDYKILPRRKDGSKQAARKTDLMKYLSDVNRSEFAMSTAFEGQVKAGMGWLESGWQDDDEGEPVYDRAESWRNMLLDSMSQEKDISDARYLFRSKWMDMDIAQAYFPSRAHLITTAAASNYDFGGTFDSYGDEAMDSIEQEALVTSARSNPEAFGSERRRVRMIECWFRRPALTKFMSGGDFAGEIFDEFSNGHTSELDQGRAKLAEKVKMRVYVAIMTTNGLIHLQESPYRHNKLPFTPLWCYRRARDMSPYGMIRGIRDLQTHINKAAAKAQYILSTNKTIMEKGAVDDLDEYTEESARPDAVIVVNPGKKLEMGVDRQLAPAHLDLMSRMIEMVQTQSGVTDESMGRTTNATSGKAILARQEQGALSTAAIYDNLRLASQIHGEKKLSLIEQFFSEEKAFRITNKRGSAEYVTINDGMPENDITLTKADYIVSQSDWNATQRQTQLETMFDVLKQVAPVAPQLILITLDLLFEMMDLPNQEEIVKRIRQVTGMKDPDADPNEPPTPEEEAQQQAKAMETAMQIRGAEAEIAEKEATAAERAARANKVTVEAQKLMSSLAGQNVDTQRAALEVALQLLSAPQLSEVGDAILMAAGYSATAATEAAMLTKAQAIARRQSPMPPQGGPMPPQDQPMHPQGAGGPPLPPEAQPMPPQGAPV